MKTLQLARIPETPEREVQAAAELGAVEEESPTRIAQEQEPLLAWGFNLADAEILLRTLRTLPFSGINYRADLRRARAAARRIMERTGRLLGES